MLTSCHRLQAIQQVLLAVATLVAVSALTVACQSISGQGSGRVNVAQAAGLAQTVRIEITDAGYGPSTRASPRVLTDQPTIQAIVQTLDRPLPLQAPAACLPQYRLRFHLSSGRDEDFRYLCQGGVAILGGDQAFWQGQQIEAPAELDRLLQGE